MTTAKARRSVLQTEILAELKVSPARSITALASDVGSSRPSVSRSLRILREQGLVEQEGRTWLLTKAGDAQVGISVAKLQEAIEESVHLTGRRFKVLDRMGLADMAAASLNHMLASQASDCIPEAAADRLAALGATAIESLAATAALAIQDQAMLSSAFGPDVSTATAALGTVPQSMAINALGPDLSSMSGVRDLGDELGIANLGRRVLQDTGASAAASVWQSIDSAEMASGSALADFGAEVGIGKLGSVEEHWLVELDASIDAVTPLLGSIGSEAIATRSNVADDHLYDSHRFSIVPDNERGKGVASIFDPIETGLFNGATSIIAAQDQFASFLTSIPPGEATLGYAAIGEQTSLFASAVDDLVALQQIDFSSLELASDHLAVLSTLPERLTAVTASFSDLFQDQVERARLFDIEPPNLVAEHMIISTLPMAHLAEAVRSWVQPTDYPPRVVRARPTREARNDKSLDARLAALNPRFVEMRHGSWHALEAKGPDYVRHAGVSYRELVRLVLHHFVPASELPLDHRRGPEIKRRLKILFGGDEKKAHFAWALTEAMFGAYDELNDHTHGLPSDEPSLRYLLHAAEGLLGFIVVNAATAKG